MVVCVLYVKAKCLILIKMVGICICEWYCRLSGPQNEGGVGKVIVCPRAVGNSSLLSKS